ncbi:hypothetical protein [Rhizobium leucaenae]|uniref:Uncharacterized protein n=1 Tax=Rhizobium leucaenae TaxID=29450 RepID=A0A7W6ZZL8_9HYPH|nr:hypothetical protein [Rhizobium leucaenae]MBB4571732.1 hypothetical protein [Rhizobium leucaenae]
MTEFRITNFKLVPPINPVTTSAIFDIEFSGGTVARGVSMLDNGTYIRLLGIEPSPEQRQEILDAALAEAKLHQR